MMNIRELGEAARKLKVKAVLQGDGAQDSLNTAWNDLEVVYVHAHRGFCRSNASINRAMAPFSFSSNRRISSIFLMECNTVV